MAQLSRKALVVAGLVALNLALFGVGFAVSKHQRSGSGIKVGLVFDVGGLGDKSFNDSAHGGLLRAEREPDAQVHFIEPGDGSDRESALRILARQGNAIVFGVGFIFTDDMKRLAGAFPNVKFACIDYSGSKTPPNLVGLRFREQEGSFLVGAIAGLTTKTRTVGFVGGMKIPLIRKFEAGYIAGVAHVCPKCQVLSAYAGTTPKAFADPTTGKQLAISQYQRGADIIYHASGKTGDGVFKAAKQLGKLAIGVDGNQHDEAPCCVLTSMVKRVDVAVFETVRALANGTFKSGVRELGLAENGVDFVYDDDNKKLLRADVVARVNELRAQIIAGEIKVPYK